MLHTSAWDLLSSEHEILTLADDAERLIASKSGLPHIGRERLLRDTSVYGMLNRHIYLKCKGVGYTFALHGISERMLGVTDLLLAGLCFANSQPFLLHHLVTVRQPFDRGLNMYVKPELGPPQPIVQYVLPSRPIELPLPYYDYDPGDTDSYRESVSSDAESSAGT